MGTLEKYRLIELGNTSSKSLEGIALGRISRYGLIENEGT